MLMEAPGSTDQRATCSCPHCGAEYCSERCRDAAAEQHAVLCVMAMGADRDAHPVSRIEALWRRSHLPPESASIGLVLRLLASVKVQLDHGPKEAAAEHLGFLRGESSGCEMQLKLFVHCHQELEAIWKILNQELFAGGPMESWLTWEQFVWVVSAMCTNAIAVGTSSLDQHEARIRETADPHALEKLGKLRKKMSRCVGPFQGCEGAAIFSVHSAVNHSCEPNCVVKYMPNSSTLEICLLYTSPSPRDS
eukprot:TRINITY_DN15364_c0_g1_i1.p1 TRINITY_DN15364_c0_g1~~TRINITY_DN15364_c0_g1_i1.p1  ORF type:complete len:250 (-),score=61.70 TRINITY_DN15364_c0_g1_i1:101-850(-)